MRNFRYIIFLLPLIFFLSACSSQNSKEEQTEQSPNVVLIFLDDAGWDFKPFTETRYPTPKIQKLAEEGRSFYSFYVPHAVCSASRAALLTGTYPERNGVFGAHAPKERGLDPTFTTMAEMLGANDYETAIFGKWHLGDQEDTWPHNRGFNETSGIMYSHDMWAGHPTAPEFWGRYPLQYWENGKVKIDSVTAADQNNFTTWFTNNAVDFINRNSDNPFFLYIPHPLPHVPLAVSEKFAGASDTGLYGDVMMEIDWSVGEIMSALEENEIKENTIVILTSDNGPWLTYGNHSGQTPFREGKRTPFDGGIRSPLIISWPGQIESNSVSHNTFFSIDFMPTIANLTGSELPDYEIDGKDVWDSISGNEDAENPHNYYSITTGNRFDGVMSSDGKWKLLLPHTLQSPVRGGKDGQPGESREVTVDTTLIDLVHDPQEKMNVIEQYPEIARQLINYAEQHKEEFFD